jgi:hypothetical protein
VPSPLRRGARGSVTLRSRYPMTETRCTSLVVGSSTSSLSVSCAMCAKSSWFRLSSRGCRALILPGIMTMGPPTVTAAYLEHFTDQDVVLLCSDNPQTTIGECRNLLRTHPVCAPRPVVRSGRLAKDEGGASDGLRLGVRTSTVLAQLRSKRRGASPTAEPKAHCCQLAIWAPVLWTSKN